MQKGKCSQVIFNPNAELVSCLHIIRLRFRDRAERKTKTDKISDLLGNIYVTSFRQIEISVKLKGCTIMLSLLRIDCGDRRHPPPPSLRTRYAWRSIDRWVCLCMRMRWMPMNPDPSPLPHRSISKSCHASSNPFCPSPIGKKNLRKETQTARKIKLNEKLSNTIQTNKNKKWPK